MTSRLKPPTSFPCFTLPNTRLQGSRPTMRFSAFFLTYVPKCPTSAPSIAHQRLTFVPRHRLLATMVLIPVHVRRQLPSVSRAARWMLSLQVGQATAKMGYICMVGTTSPSPRHRSRPPGYSECLGLWVSQYHKRGPFLSCLIPLPEMPCFPRSPAQSSDSTQITLQLHSTLTPVCDNSTSSDSTHTAPMSMERLDRVPTLPLHTNSGRIRRSPATCSPITALTQMPSFATPPSPALHRWGEVLIQRIASCCSVLSCRSFPSSRPYDPVH